MADIVFDIYEPTIIIEAEADNVVTFSVSAGEIDPVWQSQKHLYAQLTQVTSVALTGLSLALGTPITATDTILSAFGKVQKQITDNGNSLAAHISNTSNPHSVTKSQVGLGSVANALQFILNGVNGGQHAYGGTQNIDELHLHSTIDATKTKIVISRTDMVTTPVSFATQISSEKLAWRMWQWDGAAAQVKDFYMQAVPRGSSSTADWSFVYDGTTIMNLTSVIGMNLFGQESISISNSGTTTPSGHIVLANSNGTVNNFESILFRNQGGMTVGFIAMRNLSHNASTGSGDMEYWIANGAAATNVWTLKADGSFKAISIGAAATSFATQRSSNVLAFESSMWTGSAETKQTWFMRTVPNAAMQSLELRFEFGAGVGFRIVSGTVLPSYTEVANYLRVVASDASTTPSLTNGSTLFLYNTNTTVNNYSQVLNRNANGMLTGSMLYRNLSHNASTGSANLEFWLANGAAMAKVATITAAGAYTTPSTSPLIIDSFNTSDEVTNFERFKVQWQSSVLTMGVFAGGSGVHREMRIGVPSTVGNTTLARYLSINGATNLFTFVDATATARALVATSFTGTSSSGVQRLFDLIATFNQSGTAGYVGLLMNITETAVGSGGGKFLDLQIAGSSKFFIDNAGNTTWASGVTLNFGNATGAKIGAATDKLALYGATPVVRPVLTSTATYTVSNLTTDRSYDANSTTLDEIADVLGTLVTDFLDFRTKVISMGAVS